MSHKAKVIYLHQLDPQAALERLNRLTGLQFSCWPQSLRPAQQEQPAQALTMAGAIKVSGESGDDLAAAEPLSYVAQESQALL